MFIGKRGEVQGHLKVGASEQERERKVQEGI
jgi:hypothetical protein